MQLQTKIQVKNEMQITQCGRKKDANLDAKKDAKIDTRKDAKLDIKMV